MEMIEGQVHFICDVEPVSNVGIAMGKIKSGKIDMVKLTRNGKPSMVLLSVKLFDQLIPNQEPGEPVMVEW